MGLVYASADSSELMNALKSNLQSAKETTKQLKDGSQKVVTAVDGKTLAGAAYNAGKGLFSELIIPTIERVTNAFDQLAQELQTYQTADGIIASEGYLDEDILLRQIEIKKSQRSSALSSVSVLANQVQLITTPEMAETINRSRKELNNLADDLSEDIRQLEKKIEKLHTFSSSTSSLFSNSLDDLKIAMQGVLVLNNTVVSSDGSYQLPSGVDKSWFTEKKSAKVLGEMTDKQAFIQLLQEQFGFDEKTAKQIYKLKDGIDKKFPNLSQKERDYLFARILGDFSYGDGLKNGLMWPNTAGGLANYFSKVEIWAGTLDGDTRSPMNLEEILISLGLSKQEYKELQYNLRMQHEWVGQPFKTISQLEKENKYDGFKERYIQIYGENSRITFDDFWNTHVKQLNNNGDFTHQAITSATILDEKIRLANATSLYTGRFDSESVDEIAGWKGDTTTLALTPPSIGNDDYKADLDAVNITKRMNSQNISYVQASNEYYNELDKGQTNRAEEFNENVGYDYVKTEILENLAPQTKPTGISGMHPDNPPTRPTSEEEQIAYLKEHYPASYNFIESLNNNNNEYTNYHE